MAKTPKRPRVPKINRNPLARALADARFRKRVIARPDAYKRRPKHKNEPEEIG